MSFETFFSDFLATVAGGVFLAVIFFISKEKIFPVPDITGRWYLEMVTVNTDYNPYKDMVLRYVVMFWREGNFIRGSAEKIYEISSTGERSYVGVNRTRAVIEGYFEKKYFGRDRLYLHSVEDGHGRESTNFYDLLVFSSGEMKGAFNSMVANQDGLVLCKRDPF